MKSATLDPSKLLNLYLRKTRAGAKKFIFLDSDGNPFNITGIDFELFVVSNPGSRDKIINLTIGSGLSVGGASSNELTATVTSDDTRLNEGSYFWELYRSDTEKTYLNGNLIIHVGEFDGVTDTESITISDNVDTIEITIADSANAPLVNVTYSTVLNFDYDKTMYQDVGSVTFTLGTNNINGVGIILRLNTPTAVTFPANFTAHQNSATLDATKLNVYTLVYFSDWNGSGTAKVIYTNSLFTAI